MLDTSIKFSVVIPAYNEVRFLPDTLAALVRAMDALEMPGEVIVVDNNSDDGTAAVADECGARVVYESIN